MCMPGCAKAGRVAVTMTAAVLLTRIACRRHRDSHALQQVRQTLRREQRLPAVARAGEADHQPVADQLIVADALDRDQIFQPGGRRRNAGEHATEQEKQRVSQRFHGQKGSSPSSRR